MAVLLIIFCSALLLILVIMTYRLHALISKEENEEKKERTGRIQNGVYGAILCSIVGMIAGIYLMVKGSLYEGHLMEWLNIVTRVLHITFGIAWIGASFYFVFLENALNRTEKIRDEIAGDLWAVHGGGFYYLEKYKMAPRVLPRRLHWFKYEAYFTWLSGFALLFIIYYFNGAAMLIDNRVMKLAPLQAVGISIGSFIAGWVLYDLLCKSALRRKPVLFAIAGTVLLIGFAWAYSQVFNGRAAYIQFGALLGTLMAANVFFVIIPSQKAMVRAAKKGVMPDARIGKNALFRSIHNNYFTLPVLFVMVSNHFPSTFGNAYQWIVLAVISIGAAGVKHWLNLREQGKLSIWILPASVLVLLSAAYITAPKPPGSSCKTVEFASVYSIIQQRCISCHSSKPSDKIYPTAPNGVAYDTPVEIAAKKELILQRVVLTKTMPLNNKTNMTEEERELIRCWIEAGAVIK